jgi:hypothetical protein
MRFTRGTSFAGSLLLLGLALMPAACSQMMSDSSGGTKSEGGSSAKPGKASASGAYAVTFGVRNNAGRLGALQFTVRPREGGSWQGDGANVACRSLAGQSMHACNEKSGSELSCGFVDTNGISTPADIVTCTFESSKAVSGADFSIKVIDATNTAIKPVKADVQVTRVTGK